MGAIAQEDYTGNLFSLLKETFEGPPPQTASAYLDQGAGLFQTIDNLTAEEVSSAGVPGAPTIAAHCAHARFYVAVLQKYIQGSFEKVDWNESWLVQTVDATQWEALKKELRQSYWTLMEDLKAVESWGDEQVGGGMAIIAHTAYHLGAIRQLIRLIKEHA